MSSGFETETQVEERLKKRQEEWEKVRKPEDPPEAPDEPYDGRTLYERLKEQRDLKKAELDEVKKMSNQVRGLEKEEIGFLDLVDEMKQRTIAKRKEEEDAVIREMHEKSIIPIVEPIAPSTSTTAAVKRKFTDTKPMSKQAQLLSGVIKRARTSNDKLPEQTVVPAQPTTPTVTIAVNPPTAIYHAGKLPTSIISLGSGVNGYSDSSDSNSNTDSDASRDGADDAGFQSYHGQVGQTSDTAAKVDAGKKDRSSLH